MPERALPLVVAARAHAVLAALLFALTLLSAASPAHAEEGGFAHHYKPEWRRFGVWDYVGTAGVIGAYYAVEVGLDNPDHEDFRDVFPALDLWMRDLSAAETRAGRERAAKLSDELWKAIIAYSVVDSIATPLIRGFDYDSAWQMTMMNVQAFATVSLFLRVPHKLIGRSRPLTLGCDRDPNYAADCKGNGRFVSFYGGHLAVSLTAAGLVCAHHVHGDLYGNEIADAATCVAALGVASSTGYLRMRADKHWFTDQALAAGVGLSSGFLLPTLLYYRPWQPKPQRPKTATRRQFHWAALPLVTPSSATLTLFASY